MFSTAKTLSIFSVILSALNIIAAILFLFCLSSLDLGFTVEFCVILYVIASVAGSLLMTISLRSLCQDLDLNYENTAQRLHDMQKKIGDLENQLKN